MEKTTSETPFFHDRKHRSAQAFFVIEVLSRIDDDTFRYNQAQEDEYQDCAHGVA
jgi:hypothetical protein